MFINRNLSQEKPTSYKPNSSKCPESRPSKAEISKILNGRPWKQLE